MFSELLDKILGNGGGLKKSQLDMKRYKFSNFLPYIAFDGYDEFNKHEEEENSKKTNTYFMRDNSCCWIWECSPLIFASQKTFGSLAGLLREPFPDDTILQVTLYADDYIQETLNHYNFLRQNADTEFKEVFLQQAKNYSAFLNESSKKGIDNMSGLPVRNFRLFLSLRIPIKAELVKNKEGYLKEVASYEDVIKNILENLRSMGLNPQTLYPSRLIALLYRLFNKDLDPNIKHKWDINVPIASQIIHADTPIDIHKNSIQIGDNYYGMCITPKLLPKEIDTFFTNNIIGYFASSATSMDDDMNQIHSPFIFSTNIIYNNIRRRLETKAQQVLIQQAAGTLAPTVQRRKEEMLWMLDEYEKGGKFVQTIPILWVFDSDEKKLKEKVNRVRAFWDGLNIKSQQERDFMLPVLITSALPGGMYKDTVHDMDRDFILTTESSAMLTPIQAGFYGIGDPVLLFLDRRGQLVSLDISRTGPNKNFFVTGGTGGGKSFLLNYIILNYLGCGAKARIIDIGRSYQKACSFLNGQFIEMDKESDIVINFFEDALIKKAKIIKGKKIYTNIELTNFIETESDIFVELIDIEGFFFKIVFNINNKETVGYISRLDVEQISHEIDGDSVLMLTGIIASMVSSRANEELNEEQLTLIEMAVNYSLLQKLENTNIDDIHNYLQNFDKYINTTQPEKKDKLLQLAYSMSLSLQKYTSSGIYGKYFNSKSNVNFNSNIVVIELDGVPEDLRRVIVLAFANIIEQEVYKGDRQKFTLIAIDEAWQTLSENPYAEKFCEGLYRKARKYNAGVCIATQSIVDTDPVEGKLKYLGNVIRTQSAFSFALMDKDFKKAKDKGLIDVDDFEYEVFIDKIPPKSLPKYSEFFINTPFGNSCVRLITDEYSYFLFSSDAEDNIFIKYYQNKFMVEEGLTKEKALLKSLNYASELAKEKGGIEGYKRYYKTEFVNILNQKQFVVG